MKPSSPLYCDPKSLDNQAIVQTLAGMLGPVSEAEFLQSYWQKKPLVLRRGNSQAYSGIFNLGDVDVLLKSSSQNASDFDFLRSREAIPREYFAGASNKVLINRLLGLYRDGGTIHVSNVNKYSASIDRLCKSVRDHLGANTESDLWLTSHNSFTPYLHYDGHDIFVLQVHGRKRWCLYDSMNVPFAPNRVGEELSADELGQPTEVVVLEPGDLLYMPAGTPHSVTTCEPHSLHLGMGIHPITWRDLMGAFLGQLDDLPTGFTSPVPNYLLADGAHGELRQRVQALLVEAVNQVSFSKLTDRLLCDAIQADTTPHDRHFSQEVLLAVEPQSDTKLRRRGPAHVVSDKNEATLHFAGGGMMSAPRIAESSLRFIASSTAAGFTAAALPGPLDEESNLILLETLLRIGFLERA